MLLPSSIEFYKNPPPHLVEIAKGKKKKADPPKQEAKAPKPEPKPEPPGDPEWLVRRRNHYDLRGIECELLNGKPQCFMQLSRSRELCPPHVTPEFLDRADTQHICLAENSNTHYCTAKCQEGNDLVQWSAHEYKWCRENPGSCPPEPTYVPKEGFKLQEWSEELPPATKCQREALEGIFPNIKLSEISVGMLTHEPFSFAATLKSYEKYKFFELFEEFNIFVNSRTQEIDDVVKPYLDKYPNVVRLHGQPENIGINGGIVALTNMATKPFFLFLERDFQLIEPATCVVEQLKAGVDILERGIAHVVRYRHQRKPGQPNWAEKMYYGHEDDALKSHQPNLFCNLHYWYENPEDRWPDLMQVCYSVSILLYLSLTILISRFLGIITSQRGLRTSLPIPLSPLYICFSICSCHPYFCLIFLQEPKFYCSDSYYCNWTNNPQLWKVDWWNEEYVNRRFKKWTRVDPFENLEPYMNWEPDSWNNEKFIVAQGAGLFKHTDLKNYG